MGEEVLAADFNTMVQRQVVATFANAAARDAAIPSPADGMVVYLTTPGALQVRRGSAWQTFAGQVAAFGAGIPDSAVPTLGPRDILTVQGGLTFPFPVTGVATFTAYAGFGGSQVNFNTSLVALSTAAVIAQTPAGAPCVAVAGGYSAAPLAISWPVAAGANCGVTLRLNVTAFAGPGDVHTGGSYSVQYLA